MEEEEGRKSLFVERKIVRLQCVKLQRVLRFVFSVLRFDFCSALGAR